MKKKSPQKAFTLTELILVVIIIALVAGFAIPNYQKSLQKAYEKDAIVQLTALKAANQLYQAQTGAYLVAATAIDLSGINANLKLNILPNNMVYDYISADGSAFEATATWVSGSGNVTIRVNEQPMSASNPCCATPATCLTATADLADCT